MRFGLLKLGPAKGVLGYATRKDYPFYVDHLTEAFLNDPKTPQFIVSAERGFLPIHVLGTHILEPSNGQGLMAALMIGPARAPSRALQKGPGNTG